jgi:hypothetical protein
MDLKRLAPVASALLLAASTLGAPALAETTDDSSQEDTSPCSKYEGERRERCEAAYSSGTSDDSSADDSDDDDAPDCSQYETEEQRRKCEEYKQRQREDGQEDDHRDSRDDRRARDDGSVSPAPVGPDMIPATIAHDISERREFFRQQTQEHREFHQEHQEERRQLFENQSQERHEFVTDLTQRCMNRTSWDGRDARNMSRDQIREGLETYADNETRCIQEFRAFILGQQEEREDLLETQREEHREFHAKLETERDAFIQEQRERTRQRAQERHQEWQQRHGGEETPDRPGSSGRFQASDGSVDGRFVSFNYTGDPAALADVSYKGIPLFDAVALEGSATHKFRGAGFALAGANGTMTIHDNPAVAFQIHPRNDASWVLNLAPHLTVNATDDDERWRLTDGDELHGFILFEGEPVYDDVNKTFRDDESIRFFAVPERAYQASDPSDDGGQPGIGTASEDDVSNAVRSAMANGTLGAEVNLAQAENGSVEDSTVIYDNLDVSLEEKEAGKVRFVVDGELETGRTVVVNAGPGLFEGEGLSITYEDIYENGTTEEVPIRLASTVHDVMNPNDDSTPEYLPAKGAEGWQVMVSIPHFSAHAVTIQSVTSQAPPSVVAGALAAAGFLVLAGANLFRRGGRP